VFIDTTLLATVKADSGEKVVSVIGECSQTKEGLHLKGRLLIQHQDIKYEEYREAVLKRRQALSDVRI
jgi:hypothetical protein